MTRSKLALCALLGLSLVVPGLPAALAQQGGVYDNIPADAWGVVVLRDLKSINSKVIGVGQELGLPIGPGTMAGDPLAMLKGMLGIGEGLDDKGSVALVILKTEELTFESLGKSVVLLVPCSDPKAFLEQFAVSGEGGEAASKPQSEEKPAEEGAAQADLPAGVTKISLMGKSSFAMAKGKLAVLAPEPEALRTFARGKGSMKTTLGEERLALAEKKFDLFVWLNVAQAGPAIKDTVKNALMGIMLMGAMSDPTIANQVQPMIQKIEKFLDEAASLQLGLAVNKAGFDLDLYMQAKPDTALAKSIAECGATEKSLLTGLPAEKFVLAMGGPSGAKSEDVKQATTVLTGLFDKPQVKNVCDAEKLEPFKKLLAEFIELTSGGQWLSLSASRLPEGEYGMIGLTVVAEIPHAAKKWAAAFGKLVDSGLQLVTNEDARKILDAVQYKADAEKVGEAQVGHLTIDVAKLPDVGADDVTAVQKIVGKEGLLLRVAVLDEDHVAILFGGGPKRVEMVAALAKEGKSPLGDEASIKALEPNLPKGKRFFELYVAVDTLLTLINDAALAAGEKEKPIPAEIPAMNAPVAVIGTAGKDSQQINIYVPMKVVKGIKDVAMGAAADKVKLPMEPGDEPAEEKKPEPPADSGVK